MAIRQTDEIIYTSRELIAARVVAQDGEVGRVEDLYFDDRSWRVRYLVVDAKDWINREVLISPEAARGRYR